MRLTGSGVYTRPVPTPKMPRGFIELMEGLTRDVLQHNPANVYEFCANHMQQLLVIRDGRVPKQPLTLEQKIKRAQEKVRKRAEERLLKYEEAMKKLEQNVVPQTNMQTDVDELSDEGAPSVIAAVIDQENDLRNEEIKSTEDQIVDIKESKDDKVNDKINDRQSKEEVEDQIVDVQQSQHDQIQGNENDFQSKEEEDVKKQSEDDKVKDKENDSQSEEEEDVKGQIVIGTESQDDKVNDNENDFQSKEEEDVKSQIVAVKESQKEKVHDKENNLQSKEVEDVEHKVVDIKEESDNHKVIDNGNDRKKFANTKLKAPVHHEQDLTKALEVEIFHKPIVEVANVVTMNEDRDTGESAKADVLDEVKESSKMADETFIQPKGEDSLHDNQAFNLDSTISDTNGIMENNKSSSIEDNVIENDKDTSSLEHIRVPRNVSLDMHQSSTPLETKEEKIKPEESYVLGADLQHTKLEIIDISETKFVEEISEKNDDIDVEANAVNKSLKSTETNASVDLESKVVDESYLKIVDEVMKNELEQIGISVKNEEKPNGEIPKMVNVTSKVGIDGDIPEKTNWEGNAVEKKIVSTGSNDNIKRNDTEIEEIKISEGNPIIISDDEPKATSESMNNSNFNVNETTENMSEVEKNKIEIIKPVVEKINVVEITDPDDKMEKVVETTQTDFDKTVTLNSNLEIKKEKIIVLEDSVLIENQNKAENLAQSDAIQSEDAEKNNAKEAITDEPVPHESGANYSVQEKLTDIDVQNANKTKEQNKYYVNTIPDMMVSTANNNAPIKKVEAPVKTPETALFVLEKNCKDTDDVESQKDEIRAAQENDDGSITTVNKILVEESAEIKDDNDSFPEQFITVVNTVDTGNSNGTHAKTNGHSLENGSESPEPHIILNDVINQHTVSQEIPQDVEKTAKIPHSVFPTSESKKIDDTDSMGKTSSMDDSVTEEIENSDSLPEVEAIKTSSEDTQHKNSQNAMDLETAAVTIQKVFRTFLFKRSSTSYDDASIDESNMMDDDSGKVEVEFPVSATALNKERRGLGISRMDTVLQTVNEEKSLSLSTDDSSLSSAATIIQAHVRGFLVRNRLTSHKTSSSSRVNSEGLSTSLEADPEQKTNKTVLNIHIVPEGENFLSRDESLLTSMDLSLDGSPPSSTNLHPLGYDKSEPRKQLKREDAIQSISPPSNNSGKLSEDVDSVKEMLVSDSEQLKILQSIINEPHTDADIESRDDTPTRSTTIETVIEAHKMTRESSSSPEQEKELPEPSEKRKSTLTNANSDENDVVTPFEDNKSSTNSDDTFRLLHSGEFHDVVLPTKVSRSDTTVVRGE